MTDPDPVQAREVGKVTAVLSGPSGLGGPSGPGGPGVPGVPRPPGVRPRPGAVPPQPRGTCRATVRDALNTALRGITLDARDRQFLSRLVHWDKRNAAAVASLLWRARQAGRAEVALSARQMEIVLTALEDAARRVSATVAVGCWDCENIPGGRCADHARDADRARAYTELAASLAAGAAAAGAPAPATVGELQRPTDISGFRRRTSVAS